jgi:hypothetical protein
MLYPIYSFIKTRLASLNLPQEWYNVQYEETMINESGLFVEFPEPLKFDAVSKDMRRAPVKIRIHIYSKAIRTTDGIPDALVQAHEALADQVQNLLDGFTPANSSCGRLTFNGWQHWHRWKGWMVTFVEFEAKKVL